jgi:hypothetical protein
LSHCEATNACLLLLVMRRSSRVSRLQERGGNMRWHNLAPIILLLQQSLEHRTLLLDWKCLTRCVTYSSCESGRYWIKYRLENYFRFPEVSPVQNLHVRIF